MYIPFQYFLRRYVIGLGRNKECSCIALVSKCCFFSLLVVYICCRRRRLALAHSFFFSRLTPLIFL